jgi:hypothetical protein
VNKGEQVFFRGTASGSQGNAAHTRNLKEGSPIHIVASPGAEKEGSVGKKIDFTSRIPKALI